MTLIGWRLAWVVSSLVFAGVAGNAQGELERSAIHVALHAPASAAFEQTMAAFVRAGLVAVDGNAAAGTITSLPVVRHQGIFLLELVYRANVVATGDSAALVVLSGTYVARDAAGRLTPDERPITSHPHGPVAHAQAWGIIEQIAEALQAK
jgi:hypothetical protein